MSIHQLAHHLQSAGRGEDKVLVHMTPREVNGLQALAMAHGGSLTINPKTGLPEAGFLSSILPMVAGFFLGPAGLGIASSALGAGAMVGAATGIATGSLTKGLMAGLGAYGGFGLAESLAGAGAAANAAKAGVGAVDDVAASGITGGGKTMTGSDLFAKQQSLAATPETLSPLQAKGGLDAFKGYPQSAGDYIKSHSFTPAVSSTNQAILNSPTFVPPAPAVPAVPTNPTFAQIQGTNINAMPELAGKIANPIEGAAGKTVYPKAVGNVGANGQVNTNWENVKAGFSDVTSSGDKAWQFIKKNPTPFIGAGLGLLSEFSNSGSSSSGAKKQPGMMRPYEYSVAQNQAAYAPSASTAERIYFDEPRFIAKEPFAAKAGGLMALAEGGATLALPDRPPVEQATQQQAIGQNNSYPMANQRSPAYSAPTNRPLMHEVVDPSGGPEVDPYTGEPRFASGGAVASKKEPTTSTKYSYDPATMQYTQTTTETPASKQFSGNPFIDGMAGIFGVGPYAMSNPNGLLGRAVTQQKAQPVTTTETLGGVSTPYVPQGQATAAQTPAPATNIPQYQTPEQQLGLEGFYNMMGDQLAMKGAQMQAQGFANGGVARFGGGGAMQFTPEGQAKQDYLKSKGMAGQNGPRGIMRTIDDDEWARIKKENNISIPSAASAAPTYNYNPQNMQFTDNAGKVSGGVQAQFMPMPLMAPAQPEQALGMPGYQGYAAGGMAEGGYNLGGYSDGGRLLKGPGDGVSDSIPASIGNRQPARLADGEFVVPARIVSEIGNGSTEAGARKLYAMMDRVQKARKKTVGKNQVAKNTKAEKLLPA